MHERVKCFSEHSATIGNAKKVTNKYGRGNRSERQNRQMTGESGRIKNSI